MSLALTMCASSRAGADWRAPKTEELQSGRWISVDNPASQPATDPVLIRIEEMINSGHYSAASKRCVEWFKLNPASPLRDRALFLNAEALYRYGNRIKAFFYLDELLDEYPESRLFYPALEKQYQIADAFLSGYKSRFMGLAFIDRRDEAIEMLYRVQQRSPGSPLADKALLRTADYYYEGAQYDLAVDAYAAYIRSYPRSPVIPQVKLHQAFSNLAQFRGLRFDATPVVDARAQLTDIIATYPELGQQEGLPEIVQRIDGTFARKLFVTADFYKRTRQPRAAVYTYRFLINAYPDSPEARESKVQLQRMPSWALDTPAPGRGVIGVPTTGPSAN